MLAAAAASRTGWLCRGRCVYSRGARPPRAGRESQCPSSTPSLTPKATSPTRDCRRSSPSTATARTVRTCSACGRSLPPDGCSCSARRRRSRCNPATSASAGTTSPARAATPTPPPSSRQWALLDEFLDYAFEAYPVRRDRVALLGFSQGGGMAYRLAFADPERWVGLAALSTGFPADLGDEPPAEAVAALPILIQHGAQDPDRGHRGRARSARPPARTGPCPRLSRVHHGSRGQRRQRRRPLVVARARAPRRAGLTPGASRISSTEAARADAS